MRLITTLLGMLTVTLGCSQPRIVLPSALAKAHTVVPVKLKRNATFFRKKTNIQDAYQLKVGAVQTTSINRDKSSEVEVPKPHLKVSKETMIFSYSIAHDVPETVICEHIYGEISVTREVSKDFTVSSSLDTRQTITCEAEVIVETIEPTRTTPTSDDARPLNDSMVNREPHPVHSMGTTATADKDATNSQKQDVEGKASELTVQAENSRLAIAESAGTTNTISPSPEAASETSHNETETIARLELTASSKTNGVTTSLEYAGVNYRVNKLSRLGHSTWTQGVNGYEILRENMSIGAIQTTPPLRMYTIETLSSNDRAAIIFLLSSIAYNNALLGVHKLTHL